MALASVKAPPNPRISWKVCDVSTSSVSSDGVSSIGVIDSGGMSFSKTTLSVRSKFLKRAVCTHSTCEESIHG